MRRRCPRTHEIAPRGRGEHRSIHMETKAAMSEPPPHAAIGTRTSCKCSARTIPRAANCTTAHSPSVAAARSARPLLKKAIRPMSCSNSPGRQTARTVRAWPVSPPIAAPTSNEVTPAATAMSSAAQGRPDRGRELLRRAAAEGDLQRLTHGRAGEGHQEGERQERDGEGPESVGVAGASHQDRQDDVADRGQALVHDAPAGALGDAARAAGEETHGHLADVLRSSETGSAGTGGSGRWPVIVHGRCAAYRDRPRRLHAE